MICRVSYTRVPGSWASTFCVWGLRIAYIAWAVQWGYVWNGICATPYFDILENLDFAFFDKEKTGHLVSRVTGDIGEVGNIIFEMPHLAVVCLITMGGQCLFPLLY